MENLFFFSTNATVFHKEVKWLEQKTHTLFFFTAKATLFIAQWSSGLMVRVLTFYLDNLSSNLAEEYISCLFEKNKNKQRKWRPVR